LNSIRNGFALENSHIIEAVVPPTAL